MKNVKLFPSLLVTGITLGTAWAVRGQFGHEHGAAWAGGLGCLAVVLLSGREDWIKNALRITMVGGLGWGLGGMMSYGKVIGYCKGTDFANAYYGFLMLFVIGALYGFVGGALFGVSLSKEKDSNSIAWHKVIVEMVIGAFLGYFFLVEQFGWYMTPPRSELWAACFGMSLALLWFMLRNEMHSALRVALFTAFGAGFGFAFGNFLQVLGNVLEVKFNMWNVMEYTLGFSGGIAMAYAVFTSEWEHKVTVNSERTWCFPLLVMGLLIPFVMWQQNTGLEKMSTRILALSPNLPSSLPYYIKFVPQVFFLVFVCYWYGRWKEYKELAYAEIFAFFSSYFLLYILLSIVITGAFFSTHRIEQYLYLINFTIVFFYIRKLEPAFSHRVTKSKKYLGITLLLVCIVAFLALVAVKSHDSDLDGTNYRFGELANPEIR